MVLLLLQISRPPKIRVQAAGIFADGDGVVRPERNDFHQARSGGATWMEVPSAH